MDRDPRFRGTDRGRVGGRLFRHLPFPVRRRRSHKRQGNLPETLPAGAAQRRAPARPREPGRRRRTGARGVAGDGERDHRQPGARPPRHPGNRRGAGDLHPPGTAAARSGNRGVPDRRGVRPGALPAVPERPEHLRRRQEPGIHQADRAHVGEPAAQPPPADAVDGDCPRQRPRGAAALCRQKRKAQGRVRVLSLGVGLRRGDRARGSGDRGGVLRKSRRLPPRQAGENPLRPVSARSQRRGLGRHREAGKQSA